MTTTELAATILEWAREAAPALLGGYTYEPRGKTQALPDVVVEISNHRRVQEDPRFPLWQMQQRTARLWTWDVVLSVMVDTGDDEASASAAADEVRALADTLLDAVEADLTLGGRVASTWLELEADFAPGYVQYPDGSTGRDVRLALTVAELKSLQ